MTGLHLTLLGGSGPRIVFCHGLFGQGRNWTGIAKSLVAQGFRCVLVDLPNHGRSPWTEHFSYAETAALVADELTALGTDGDRGSVLVGHSLGGKVVMRLALDRPDLVDRLVVVDMAPVRYERMGAFARYVAAMQAIDLTTLTDRVAADDQLRAAVPDTTVRGFLLQNLRREPGSRGRWYWQPNLGLFGRELAEVGAWDVPADTTPYPGPVLWVAGADSDYIRPEYGPAMRALFPRTQLVTVKRAGHWVHSEQPEVFTQLLARFARG